MSRPSTRIEQLKTKCSIKVVSNNTLRKGREHIIHRARPENRISHSWGLARLGSSITVAASKIDYHTIMEHCQKNSKALKLAEKIS